ncbi:MAG: apolipoprotein N-acyltransferase [Gammaproteobacteria bacterium]
MKKYLHPLIAIIAGALTTTAFAPFHAFFMAYISLIALLFTWRRATPKDAFILGLLFGIGMFSTGVYWVYISIHTYGQSSTVFAFLLTALFIFILALFPAITGYLLNRFFAQHITLAFPALWVSIEWLRGYVFTGFPWLYLGYSQINTPLKHLAPWVGVYGVSFVVTLIAVMIFQCVFISKKQKILFAFCIIAITTGIFLLPKTPFTKPSGEAQSVALVQGNIPQTLKWTPEEAKATMQKYLSLSENIWKTNIIIWPEAAIPVPLQYIHSYIENIDTTAKQNNSTLLMGIPIEVPSGGEFYNAVIAKGHGQGQYLKRHLVPFGEYFPLPKIIRNMANFFNIPMSDFIPGPKQQKLIKANDINVATFICYEIAYPLEVHNYLNDAKFILVVSDDAWFGDSIAQAQHLEIAQMRALETGRYIAFSSNNGPTAIIDPQGIVTAFAPTNQPFVLIGKIIPMEGKTPWLSYGAYVILLLIIGFLALSAWLQRYVN